MVLFYTIDDNVRKKIAWRRKEVCAENPRSKERPRNSAKTPTNRSRYVDRIISIDRPFVCKQPPETTIPYIRFNFMAIHGHWLIRLKRCWSFLKLNLRWANVFNLGCVLGIAWAIRSVKSSSYIVFGWIWPLLVLMSANIDISYIILFGYFPQQYAVQKSWSMHVLA